MDLLIIGKFIAERRKEKKLTQQKLAEQINVSTKTISKWECGKGFPDTSLMLPLCQALDITSNELLSGKLITDDKYKQNAEKRLVELAEQQIYKDKLLLSIEWLIIVMMTIIILGSALIAGLASIAVVWRILLMIFAVVCVIVCCYFGLRIEKDAGYYKCQHCYHKYVPTFRAVFFAMHAGRTRYMKCPQCGKKSWQTKTLTQEDKN